MRIESFVQDAAEVDASPGLADNRPENRVAEELADLVLDGCNGLGPVLRFPMGKLAFPEALDDWVGDPAREHFSVGSVCEKPLEREKGRAGRFDKCEQRVAKDVLHAWAPTVAVELLECRDDAGGDQWALCRVRASQRVERERKLAVAGVEQDNIVRAVRWNGIEDCLGEVPVGVDECQASAGADVGNDKLVKERGFSHARLADDRQVPAAVVGTDAESVPPLAKSQAAECGDGRFLARDGHVDRWLQLAALGDSHGRGANGGRGRVPQRGEFLARQKKPTASDRLGWHGRNVELGHAWHGELAERPRHLVKDGLRLRGVFRQGCHGQSDMSFKNVSAQFVGRGLKILFSIMGSCRRGGKARCAGRVS